MADQDVFFYRGLSIRLEEVVFKQIRIDMGILQAFQVIDLELMTLFGVE